MSLPPTFCRYIIVGECPWGDRCKFRHDIVGCSCGLAIKQEHVKSHTRGRRHRQLLAELQARMAAGGVRDDAVPPPPNTQGLGDTQQDARRCPACRRYILASQYDLHMDSHMQQQRMRDIHDTILENEQDKGGIEVNWKNGVDFSVVQPDTILEVEVQVANTTTSAIALLTCRIGTKDVKEQDKFFTARLKGKSKLVHPNTPRTVRIRFVASEVGRYEDTLALIFTELQQRNTFIITRKVFATIGDPELHDRLKPETPYTRHKGPRMNITGRILPSTRPPEWSKPHWVERLPKYDVPAYVIEAAFGKQYRNAVQNIRRLMPTVFNTPSYGKWFQYLLYVEEEQMRQDLLAYAMTDVEIQADYPRYNLKVEGLAEGRPSVLVGDYILVSRTEEADDGKERTWYEGRVHRVLLDRVSLRFRDDFSAPRGMKFDVQFVFNRISYRRMYHILLNSFDPKRLLFPGPEHIQHSQRPTAAQKADLVLFNRKLEGDDEQLGAIAAILNMAPGSVPFIVFGPPGTGKTVTIVEAIQQILSSNPDHRILACAPSNSAADLIAQNLMNLGTSVVFRLNSITRNIEDLPKTLKPFSLYNENIVFAIPHAEELAKYRVVVSTCLSGGVPASLGLKRGHFSHIFIDEAGQGKEPEVMVPIKSIAGKDTNVVLAGDNQQLGPIVHSSTTKTLGLGKSYLTRLMAMDIYDIEGNKPGVPGGRGTTIVKLVKNFRSHPDILHFPNMQFYKNELQPCGDFAMVRSLEKVEDLPRRGFPIIFHGIVGKDEREKTSPSFFNADEVILVKKYCESLVYNRKNGIRPEHIGVITPYHAQRCKIKFLIDRNPKLEGITVGSVEQFQGQERRVIIISTVRSNENYIVSDIRRSLGFVADQRRFNVAITRAQALLIVVGNPTVLSLDPLWRGFMNYVYLRGGWKGRKIDWDPAAPLDADVPSYDAEMRSQAARDSEEMIARLKAMIVKKHEDEDLDIDALDVSDEEGSEDGAAGAVERPIIREYE
ncbi:RNA helicase [Macrolepiota fuliginosa MF-IS2]|uniref:RNA helicase n=1 Tax=Macrolepiota fuliginosa MF-IS2 TaxID=1400762 RepID=A0A9P6BZE0_9AGAR|nr:RNA helicase [Macrolepiota fuliginosa MF-IS2]